MDMTKTNSQHKKMSGGANHDWLISLQHSMLRSASKRGKHFMMEPLSPASSDRCLLRTDKSRSRLMTDPIESSPARRSKNHSVLQKPALHRRSTTPCLIAPDIDIPFEISIHMFNSEQEEADDVSEITLFEDDDNDRLGWGTRLGDKLEKAETPHFFESSGSSSPRQAWGMTTLRLDDHDVWPSDEGSPIKKKVERVEERTEDLPPMMLQLCSLEDERQDYSMMTLASTDAILVRVLDEDRHEQPYVT